MDNINYNPNDNNDDNVDVSGRVLKSVQDRRGLSSPTNLLRQMSTHVDNSPNLSMVKKWSGILLACIALLVVTVRWSEQEKLIQSNRDR